MNPLSSSDTSSRPDLRLLLTPAVIVGALGYFVDIYDLLLFSIVRTPSLKDLGLTGDALASQGLMLLSLQMAGMLIGGIVWGIIGDKKGRLWLLFGSIALYSTATFVNGLVHTVTAGRGILWAYLGLTFGDFLTGTLSQLWGSRKKVVLLGIVATTAGVAGYFSCRGVSAATFYTVIFLMGIGIGYWAVFVTIAAEQFGTNIRATVATTVPNFARGALIPITLLFQALKSSFGLLPGGLYTGLICLSLALLALWRLRETYGTDLDYVEPL